MWNVIHVDDAYGQTRAVIHPMPRAQEEMGNDGGMETSMASRPSAGRSKPSSPRRKGAGARGYPAGRSLMG